MDSKNIICQMTGKPADDLKCIRCVVESDKYKTCPLYVSTLAFLRGRKDKSDIRDIPFEDRGEFLKAKQLAEQKEAGVKGCGCLGALLGLGMMLCGFTVVTNQNAMAILVLLGLVFVVGGTYIFDSHLAELIGSVGAAWTASGTITDAVNNLADLDKTLKKD